MYSFGVEYNCGEQYMMAKKAEMFDDYETLMKIMDTPLPNEQKSLGRRVKNFDADKWDKESMIIMFNGLRQKFKQNPNLLTEIIFTGKREFVEASPVDKIWGIGMSIDDPDIEEKSKWRGQNKLGRVLTAVREILVYDINADYMESKYAHIIESKPTPIK